MFTIEVKSLVECNTMYNNTYIILIKSINNCINTQCIIQCIIIDHTCLHLQTSESSHWGSTQLICLWRNQMMPWDFTMKGEKNGTI